MMPCFIHGRIKIEKKEKSSTCPSNPYLSPKMTFLAGGEWIWANANKSKGHSRPLIPIYKSKVQTETYI